MTVRQWVGYRLENYLIQKNHLIPSEVYTSPFDATTSKGIDVQIKVKKIKNLNENSKTSLDFGAFSRLPKEKDFKIVVANYQQQHDKAVVKKVYTFNIEAEKWNSFLEEEAFDLLKPSAVFNNIPCGHQYDNLWRNRRRLLSKSYRENYNDMSAIFRPRFKRDSKGQKRIQVGIPFNKLFEFSNNSYLVQDINKTFIKAERSI